MPTPFDDHLTTLSPITRKLTTKETFSIALGVRSVKNKLQCDYPNGVSA